MKTMPRPALLTNAATDYVIALYTVDYLLNQEGRTCRATCMKVESARKRIVKLAGSDAAARRLITYLAGFEDSLYRSHIVRETTGTAADLREALGLDEARWQSRLLAEIADYRPYQAD